MCFIITNTFFTGAAPSVHKIEMFYGAMLEYSFKQKHKDKNRNGNINDNALYVCGS
jgi:hypothetical protein